MKKKSPHREPEQSGPKPKSAIGVSVFVDPRFSSPQRKNKEEWQEEQHSKDRFD